MKGVFLILGSNLEDRFTPIRKATELISNRAGKIVQYSAFYESEPWGYSLQPNFINQVVELETDLSAESLLNILLEIELDIGRKRMEKWTERLIDIDILYYGSSIVDLPDLKIPHPELQNRRFTLVPLCEIAPKLIHPVLKKNQVQLLDQTTDQLKVYPVEAPQNISQS